MPRPNLNQRRNEIDEIILGLGGTVVVAKLAGVVPSAVSNWRRLGRFPARTYILFSGRLAGMKKSAPGYLWGLAAEP